MATQLDLQEQEQLDALKAFWKQYGNAVTWVLIALMGAYAAFNGWQYWQRDQGLKAGAMFEELDRAAAAGDAERAGRIFADLKDRYGRTTAAQQGALLAAKVQYQKGQGDAAKASLTWLAEQGADDEMKAVARLRLSALQLDARQYDEALKTLAAIGAPGFEGLVADRRGDVLLAQGKADEAKAAYQAAYKAIDERLDYRHLIDAKLTALGASPEAPIGATVEAAAPTTAPTAAAASAAAPAAPAAKASQ